MIRVSIILLLLLSSCGPNFYLKKAERALKKAEQLGAKVTADTIYKERLVFVDSIRVDSIFTSKVGDTVYISKDRLKVKYVRLPGDSVFIEGKCEADTIKIQVPVMVNKEIKSGLGVWDVIKWALFALVIGALLCKLLWK
jgi:hypothetical protein